MQDTLEPLIDKALRGRPRLLEFYLREQSHLPGPRANLALAYDLAHLLALHMSNDQPAVETLLTYLLSTEREDVQSNTPAEFTVLCGLIALGACAAVWPDWRAWALALLEDRALSPCWRIREGVVMAYQQLLPAASAETLAQLSRLAAEGLLLHQRAAVAALAEPSLLLEHRFITAALSIHRQVLERLHRLPPADRHQAAFRSLRQTLGYSLSVVTAAAPEEGFALMQTCASWNDKDIAWILRENLKKKRLARFSAQAEALTRLLQS
ncbi:hypothetical protein [Thermogemmatispora tikiterensis]|uniref:Uncharacterized protein n=1 Tax=Thermogemmatispora tikiterensis TaxID=1825093 RepID=A0A328VG98_9CHLR|nr:hypothetical protein [Thermogemmatispora tikiterensis]RAQ95082.1 hypothetical protein A4R35_06010 [Thermogemmatispora tikiterensis]